LTHFRNGYLIRWSDLMPRDDLESLAYLLFFLLRGDLPWRRHRSVDESMRQSNLRIRASKAAYLDYNTSLDSPAEFGYLLEYSRAMSYDQFPDYEDLKGRFKNLSMGLGCTIEEPLDWEPSDTTYIDPPFPFESFQPEPDSYNDRTQDCDLSNFEGLSDSYFGWDVADYEIQDNRFRSLTMPVEQEASLDQDIPQIVEVQRQGGSLEIQKTGLPISKPREDPSVRYLTGE
jgi:hypothetical protein